MHTDIEAFRYWPLAVPIQEHVERVALSNLPDSQKRKAWRHLQSEHPTVASLLDEMRADPVIQELIQTMGATIELERRFLPHDIGTTP